MRFRLFGASVLSLGLLAAACANASSGDGAVDGSTGDPTGSGGISYPTDADQVALRIDSGGGFVAVEVNLTTLPMLSLFGDGLLITPGVQTEIYPGPALPALAQERLSPDAIQLLVRAALDAGLDADRTYTDLGSVGIADAPTTTFTLMVEGQTHTTTVYALGELGPKPDAMSSDEYQARKELLAFETKATGLSWLPDGSVTDQGMYRPSAVRVFSSDYRTDGSMTEPAIGWPLNPGLATFGDPVDNGPAGMRCGAVAADAAATLLPLVEQANQLTPWTSDGRRYALLFRPLLPDESGC
jgi:hypothetical protein